MTKEMRIAIVGVGGVGGFLSATLAKTYPHVTVVARNDRGAAIRERGLILHSDQCGEITARPEQVVSAAGELEEQDIVFLCVKNYSLEEVCRELKNVVNERTIVVPVMNGTDPGDRVRSILGRGIVVDSLIYIVAFSNPDYSTSHRGPLASLRVGARNADSIQEAAVQTVAALLSGAGIDCKASEDIECEIWRKYILNCAYNVATARYNSTIGQLRSDPEKAAEYEALVREAYQVARAKGVRVLPEHVDGILHRFYHVLQDDATSSLQRDVWAGRPSELETFSGHLVRESELYGVDVPVSRRMYHALKDIVSKV